MWSGGAQQSTLGKMLSEREFRGERRCGLTWDITVVSLSGHQELHLPPFPVTKPLRVLNSHFKNEAAERGCANVCGSDMAGG